MRDPLFPSSPLLQRLTQPLATRLHLHTLPYHMHEILPFFLLYHLSNTQLFPYLSRRLFPQTYASLPLRTQRNWNVHCVSMLQSVLINAAALYVLAVDGERKGWGWRDRVYGYSPATGAVQAMSAGYFAWDLMCTAGGVEVQGWGALVHAVAALVVSMLGFRPFVNYHGLHFVLYELSTPFLNVHWFCDKLGLTGSKLQLYNGIALIVTFGGCRLIWGSWASWFMLKDVWRAMQEPGELPVPRWLAAAYLASTLVLSGLNFWWFGKMIQTVMARFDGSGKKPRKTIDEKEE